MRRTKEFIVSARTTRSSSRAVGGTRYVVCAKNCRRSCESTTDLLTTSSASWSARCRNAATAVQNEWLKSAVTAMVPTAVARKTKCTNG
jgi:hypothetical protein